MLLSGLRRVVHEPAVLATIARDPGGTLSRFYDDYVYARERHRPQCPYEWTADWEERLHRLLGSAWPCAEVGAPAALWPPIVTSLKSHGIDVGPESYLYWNDGDPALIRTIWCVIRHLKPEKVIETGVAHGVSSRFIIEALEANAGAGHLWSIDLPPLRQVWQDQVGIVVEARHRPRWTLLRGSSRRKLVPLLKELGTIDLFIHDSLHSERNLRFEMDHAWERLRPGGAMVIDDVDANWGFQSFLDAHQGYTAVICEAEPVRPDFRRFNEKGLFGVVLKNPVVSQAKI